MEVVLFCLSVISFIQTVALFGLGFYLSRLSSKYNKLADYSLQINKRVDFVTANQGFLSALRRGTQGPN